MCGLFGAIGPGINPLIIRALAIANRTRGKESLGMFDSTGKKIKSASDPTTCLTQTNFSAFIERKHWFIAGHTRKSTRGTNNKKNAHPFRYGNYIGAHNGQCVAPYTYDVDSMYLFDKLHQCRGDYAKAFEGIQGYWALTWFDGSHFYLMAHDNKLTLARKGNTWYYSSDRDHLNAAIGKADEWITLEDGATVCFSRNGKLQKLEAFKSDAGRGHFYKATTSGYTSTVSTYIKPAASEIRPINHAAADLPAGYSVPSIWKDQPRQQYTQPLTWSEYQEADEWADDLGYGTFYGFMRYEGYYNEYSAYSKLARAINDQHDNDEEEKAYEEEALYDDYDNEQTDREAQGLKPETYDEWLERKESEEDDGIDHCAEYADDRNAMDADFEAHCRRDEFSDERLD